jgi:hypothetical protein
MTKTNNGHRVQSISWLDREAEAEKHGALTVFTCNIQGNLWDMSINFSLPKFETKTSSAPESTLRPFSIFHSQTHTFTVMRR